VTGSGRAMHTFADVVAGKRSVHVVHEDAGHLAFLAPEPQRRGHVIVVTKRVVDQFLDLDADAHAALWACVRTVGQRLRERLPCERVCMAVIGWQVRHVHVHLVPTDAPGQMPALGGKPVAAEQLAALAARLQPDTDFTAPPGTGPRRRSS
jgi:histidine triad (HIT) family protein